MGTRRRFSEYGVSEMADALPGAALLHARWLRAVDLLWRETVRRRQTDLDLQEQMRAEKRLRALRRIVRKALADYHRIQLARERDADRA